MGSKTRTVPKAETRPMSLRERSRSIRCSARSFSSLRSSSASLLSSSSSFPLGRVPAMGRVTTLFPSERRRLSGLAETSTTSPRSR